MNVDLEIEKQWISDAKTDPAAFENLFNKYYNIICNYILRRTADQFLTKDIAASTFMKALNQIHRFQWNGLPFSCWLYRIATNEINQHFRKNRKLVSLTESQMAILPSDTSTESQLLADEELKEKALNAAHVQRALTKIKQPYQDVLTLRYYENLSIRDIAGILNLPENTVRTHIRRGLKQLGKQL